jgi:hypothetical protein
MEEKTREEKIDEIRHMINDMARTEAIMEKIIALTINP